MVAAREAAQAAKTRAEMGHELDTARREARAEARLAVASSREAKEA